MKIKGETITENYTKIQNVSSLITNNKDIKKQLSKKEHWSEVENIIESLQQKGFQTVVVGGAVRDALLKKVPKDIDLATKARPEEVLKTFPSAKGEFAKYGVVFIPLKTKKTLEITSFRKEAPYKDGRRPSSISYGSMEEDAERRDFTINALFYDPKKEELMDFTEGQKDLQNKILKTVGKAKERFEEDHLRALRALRLAHQLKFQIEGETKKAIPAFAEKIKKISKERILEELEKMFSSGRLGIAIKSLEQHNVFYSVFPDLKSISKNTNLKNPFDFWNKDFSFYKESAFFWTALALPFFYSNAKGFKLFLKNLLVPSSQIKQSLSYLQALQSLTNSQSSFAQKLLALNGQKEPLAELAGFWLESLGQKRDSLNKIIEEFEKRQNKGQLPPPLVTGSDLLQLKACPERKKFSAILNRAYEYQIEKPQASKSEVLKYILSQEI